MNSKHRYNARLDHAAIATRDPGKLNKIFKLLGLTDGGSEPVPSQGVTAHFQNPVAGLAKIEILEPMDSTGTVAKYLDKKGTGIHHLSFMVDGLDDLCDELKKNGVRLVFDSPKPGTHQTRVNFIHPEATGGVLIEISESC